MNSNVMAPKAMSTRNPAITQLLLFAMMFTVYFLMGTSTITLTIFMNQVGMKEFIVYAVACFPLSMILSPLLFGSLADRHFAANKIISVLFISSGILLCLAVYFSNVPLLFLTVFFIYKLLYAPTLGLANSIAMANVENREKSFPIIRVGGTVGWIVAATVISFLHAEKMAMPFLISGVVAIISGIIFFFILPHTPPVASNASYSFREIFGLDAFKKLNVKGSGFKVFMVTCFFGTMLSMLYDQYGPLYFNSTGLERTAAYMSIGQVSEIVVMSLVPLFCLRFSLKTLMTLGLLSLVARYGLLLTNTYVPHIYFAVIAIAFGGFIMSFYVVVSQMIMDMLAEKSIQAQAQSLMMFISMGLGSLVGSSTMGYILNVFVTDVTNVEQWRIFWLMPVIVSVLTVLPFVFGFKGNLKNK